jgi:hypothetical protein
MAPEKSDREQQSVRLAMCERSPLGLSHTQNHVSCRPRVAEAVMLLLRCVCLLLQYLLQSCSRGGGGGSGGHEFPTTLMPEPEGSWEKCDGAKHSPLRRAGLARLIFMRSLTLYRNLKKSRALSKKIMTVTISMSSSSKKLISRSRQRLMMMSREGLRVGRRSRERFSAMV